MPVLEESRASTSTRPPNPGATTVAILVVLHATAHLVGVIDAFAAFADDGDLHYFFEGWTISHPGALALVAALWTMAAAGLAAGSVLSIRRAPSARPWLTSMCLLSLGLCVAALPAAAIGIAVNLVVLAFIGLRSLLEWSWGW